MFLNLQNLIRQSVHTYNLKRSFQMGFRVLGITLVVWMYFAGSKSLTAADDFFFVENLLNAPLSFSRPRGPFSSSDDPKLLLSVPSRLCILRAGMIPSMQ